jgi:hypothetical protein
MLKKYLTLKWLLRLAIPLLVLLLMVLFFTHTFPFNKSADEMAEGQKQETQLNADNKKGFIENGGSSNTGSSDSSSSNSAPAQNDDSTNIQLSARQETNGSVTVFTKLYGFSAGSCQLDVSSGSNTESQTAEIIYQSQFSTCAGFSVPSSKLGSGTWKIKLTTTSAGSIKTKTISFEAK